jgi:hypothetical protein
MKSIVSADEFLLVNTLQLGQTHSLPDSDNASLLASVITNDFGAFCYSDLSGGCNLYSPYFRPSLFLDFN